MITVASALNTRIESGFQVPSAGESLYRYFFSALKPEQTLSQLAVVGKQFKMDRLESEELLKQYSNIFELLIDLEKVDDSIDGLFDQRIYFGRNVRIRGHFPLHSALMIYNNWLSPQNLGIINNNIAILEVYKNEKLWDQNTLSFWSAARKLCRDSKVSDSEVLIPQFERQLRAFSADIDVVLSRKSFEKLKQLAINDSRYLIRKAKNGKEIIYFAPNGVNHPEDAVITEDSVYVEFLCEDEDPLENYGTLGRIKMGMKPVKSRKQGQESEYAEPFYTDKPRIEDGRLVNEVRYGSVKDDSSALDSWLTLRSIVKDLAYTSVFNAKFEFGKDSEVINENYEIVQNLVKFLQMPGKDPGKRVVAMTIGKAFKELSLAFFINQEEAIGNAVKIGLFDIKVVEELYTRLETKNFPVLPMTSIFTGFLLEYLRVSQEKLPEELKFDLPAELFVQMNTHCFNLLSFMLASMFTDDSLDKLLNLVKKNQENLGIDPLETAFGRRKN